MLPKISPNSQVEWRVWNDWNCWQHGLVHRDYVGLTSFCRLRTILKIVIRCSGPSEKMTISGGRSVLIVTLSVAFDAHSELKCPRCTPFSQRHSQTPGWDLLEYYFPLVLIVLSYSHFPVSTAGVQVIKNRRTLKEIDSLVHPQCWIRDLYRNLSRVMTINAAAYPAILLHKKDYLVSSTCMCMINEVCP